MASFDWKLDGGGFGQSTAESCWYAAYAMIFGWKGRPRSSIRERIEKAGLDYADYYKNGLPQEDFPKTRSALGLTGFRGGYVATLADDLDYFGKTLKDYGPMWCAFKRPGAHVVVISGVDTTLKQIHILNPWNNSNGGDADSQYLEVPAFRLRLNKDVDSVAQFFY